MLAASPARSLALDRARCEPRDLSNSRDRAAGARADSCMPFMQEHEREGGAAVRELS